MQCSQTKPPLHARTCGFKGACSPGTEVLPTEAYVTAERTGCSRWEAVVLGGAAGRGRWWCGGGGAPWGVPGLVGGTEDAACCDLRDARVPVRMQKREQACVLMVLG